MTVATSNARVDLTVASTMSGVYDITTSNGPVDLTVGSSAKYRLDAQTSNGNINFSLPNLTYTRNQATSKAAESAGYSSAQVKIQATIRTSNAAVNVDSNVLST